MNDIKNQAAAVATELLEKTNLRCGDIVVIGCSSSEIVGGHIGKASSVEVGDVVFKTMYEIFSKKGVYVAAQCCEHLNRAIIIEREAANKDDIVNVVPFPKAGGSFATAAYATLKDPVAVEHIKADAGVDIGDTLIGMHLRAVAVPLRLDTRKIGEANVVCARTRPKLIGGERAHYNENIQ